MEPHRPRRKPCPRPVSEQLLTSIVGGLFAERRIPPGAIFNAGAHHGHWACFYSQMDPARRTYAMDPDAGFVRRIRRKYAVFANLRPVRGALSSVAKANVTRSEARRIGLNLYPDEACRPGRVAPAGSAASTSAASASDSASSSPCAGRSSSSPFPIYTLDDFFASERLGFAHLDLEGHELDALNGAGAVCARDLPVLTTEVVVHLHPARTAALLTRLDAMGYDSFLLEEIAGLRPDTRNLLNIPRARTAEFLGAHALDLAAASRALVAVTNASVFEYAFPCCRRGGACCPLDRRGRARGCCSHWRVDGWVRERQRGGSEDVRDFSRTRWYEGFRYSWAAARQMAVVHAADRKRERNLSAPMGGGLSQPMAARHERWLDRPKAWGAAKWFDDDR
jgi:FkbM family methyltransferase